MAAAFLLSAILCRQDTRWTIANHAKGDFMRLWPRQKRYQMLAASGLCLALIVIIDQIWVFWNRHFTVSPATTYITVPLSGRYPDYVAAINTAHSAGVTPDNNAVPLVIEAVGLGLHDLPAEHAQETLRILNIAPPVKALHVPFKQWIASEGIRSPEISQVGPVAFDGFVVPQSEDPPEWLETEAFKSPWTPTEHPLLAKYIAAMEPALVKLDEASRRRHFYFPSVRGNGKAKGAAQGAVSQIMLPSLGSIRAIANTLIARSMMRIGSNDTAGFTRDILTGLRLARLLAQQPSVIEHLVATAIDTLSMRAVQAGATTNRLTAAEARMLRLEIEKLAVMPSPVHALDECERFMLLDAIMTLHAGNIDGSLKEFKTLGRIVPLNYNNALERCNQTFDRAIKGFGMPRFSDRAAAFDLLENDVELMQKRGAAWKVVHFEVVFISIFMPSFGKLNELCTANSVERDLARSSLILCETHADSQAYPETLDRFPGIPHDQFSGHPLIYRRQQKGYLLYSVGIDLKDDHGKRGRAIGQGDISVECPE